MACQPSIPTRLLVQRFFALRGAYREVQITTDFSVYEHGRSVELLGEQIERMESLIHRLTRMKQKQI